MKFLPFSISFRLQSNVQNFFAELTYIYTQQEKKKNIINITWKIKKVKGVHIQIHISRRIKTKLQTNPPQKKSYQRLIEELKYQQLARPLTNLNLEVCTKIIVFVKIVPLTHNCESSKIRSVTSGKLAFNHRKSVTKIFSENFCHRTDTKFRWLIF